MTSTENDSILQRYIYHFFNENLHCNEAFRICLVIRGMTKVRLHCAKSNWHSLAEWCMPYLPT